MPTKIVGPESWLPEWVKPENASVFDPWYRQSIRDVVALLGLADPQQIMSVGGPLMAADTPLGPLATKVTKAARKAGQSIAEAVAEPAAELVAKAKALFFERGGGQSHVRMAQA